MEKKELRHTVRRYQEALKNSSVKQIEFHFEDGSATTIDSEELIKLLLDTLVIGLESQEHKLDVEELGEFRENIENTREYKVAMQLENNLNNFSFSNQNFVESIPFMHRTLQQNMFRLFKDSFLYMARLNERCIDGRNRGAYETSKKIAEILDEAYMPYI